MSKTKAVINGLLWCTLIGTTINYAVGRSDPGGATKLLTDFNFHDVTIKRKEPAGFFTPGYYRTQFSAVNVAGKPVSGVVTQGWKCMNSNPVIRMNP